MIATAICSDEKFSKDRSSDRDRDQVDENLAADDLDPVMAWLTGLPYPWCPAQIALEDLPKPAGLAGLRAFLARG